PGLSAVPGSALFSALGALTLETSLQILDLFFDLLAALLSVKEDVVRIAILLFQIVVHVAEPGGVLLLQVLQGVDQLVVGLSASVFQRDSISVDELLAKQAKMIQTFKAQKRGLKTAVQGLQSFISVEFREGTDHRIAPFLIW